MHKCRIKASGCLIMFEPKSRFSKVCYNPECQRINHINIVLKWNANNPNKLKDKTEEVKKNNKSYRKALVTGKKIRRICLGVNCRGQKSFWSLHGRRICDACREIINTFEDTYSFTSQRSRRS